ncbi:putative membrane protein [Terriglobus roseus DSM 18391]|uniref:Putative membrane protein n=1 Tax=Terriglobus roseus (strain DSM 18391 / NRRL B-41598 / KBS 63) TaxID=926566 RepID=I3ZCI3_TERRK|nr:DUF1003 domain-containing protein [Terriglobus roseus]AFL86951.1 putative membrane protein [Terriglobus roseus DSM 18391]
MARQHVQEHIDLIAKHEQEFFENRTRMERAGDAIASFAGSLRFVALHLVCFAAWILWNTLPALADRHFDPYPFAMLDTIVAIEAILLASFILMRQSRTSRRSDERDHLILQVLLLTEKEVTALLQVTRKIAAHHGMENVTRDRDLAALARETPIDEVAENIKESFQQEQ